MFFKAIINMIRAGGNFGYVAQNVATIYNVITNSPSLQTINYKQTLFAVALCDLTSYYKKGLLQIEDAAYAVDAACLGCLLTNSNIITHSDTSDDCMPELLVNLTMELLLIVYCLDTRHDESIIMQSILENKDKIRKTIDKELKKGSKGSLYKDVYRNIHIYCLCNKNNREVILNYESYVSNVETFTINR